MLFEHAFGKRYELPVPLALFVVAGGAAVLLSFFLIAMRAARVEAERPVRDEFPAPMRSRVPSLVGLLGLAGLIAAGVGGSQEVAENIVPTFFWLVVWIVVPLSCGLLGDWTRAVNPFATLARLSDRPGVRRALLGSADPVVWPRALGWWPAAATFFVVASGELIYNHTATLPRVTAYGLLVGALASAFLGLLFGADVWLSRGEMFSVLFNTWGRLGFFRFGAAGRRGMFGGLSTGFDADPSRLVFTLMLLVSVSFDGLISTPQWNNVHQRLGSGVGAEWLTLLVFVGVAAATLAVFTGFAIAAMRVGGVATQAASAIAAMLPSLLPIAFGYLLAHNLQYLLINGQLLIPLLGNPVGHPGWQWLPAPFNDSYEVNTGILPSGPYWYAAVTIIVVAHIVAVVIAHRDLAASTRDERSARRAEYPWLIAMVAYTMVSLWLLAQPLVQEKDAAALGDVHSVLR